MEIIDATKLVKREGIYPKRGNIRRIYVHHSGREGAPALRGAINTSRYVVTAKGFPGPAYHYWIPRVGSEVFQLNSDERRAWHTGGRANAHGIGVCVQGNTTSTRMPQSQMECLRSVLEMLMKRYAKTLWTPPVSWHSASAQYGGKAKPACPGKHATVWLQQWQGGLT